MNFSPGAVAPKLRTILVLVAAVAAFGAVGIASTASAGAASGGVTASGGDSGGGKYQRLWKKTSRHNRRWANKTAQCESGKDPNAVGGGGKYRGAFQFLKQSWHHAPKTPGGDPIDFSYRTQAVVAVALKKREGTKPWPVCG